jgi:histidinol dehydrogenase
MQEAAEDAEAAVETARETVEEALEAVAESGADVAAAAEEALDGLSWDAATLSADEILARIDEAEINPMLKQGIRAAFEQAQNSPEALQAVLDELRRAVGE